MRSPLRYVYSESNPEREKVKDAAYNAESCTPLNNSAAPARKILVTYVQQYDTLQCR
jgi:hypothetical protein